MKDSRYICYPFMNEDNWATDYEVLTDGLSSEISFAASFNKGEIKKDLEKIVQLILDINPMIRKPSGEIISETKKELNNLYDKYEKPFNSFYLPIGNTESTSISKLRLSCKRIIRLIVANDKNQNDLLDIFHLVANLFHHMYLAVTNKDVKYVSKTY